MQEITTIISNVGFPIACVIGLFYYINTTMAENTKALNKLCSLIEVLINKEDEKK